MLIKAEGGKRGGAALAKYLTGELDHKNEARAAVRVLRGDPALTGAVADSLKFKHKLTHAVIAWAPEDRPSQAQVEASLDSFARLAWAGLDQERISWSAIQHDEGNGGTHVHLMIARVDLATGKALNPLPPGWQKQFGHWRDMLNLQHGWARPDDPARARLAQGRPLADRDALVRYVADLVAEGAVNDREGVLSALQGISGVEVTRTVKTSITVAVEGRKMRLKGDLFHDDFQADRFAAANPAKADRGPEADRAAFEAAAAGYAKACESRARFNQDRFAQPVDPAIDHPDHRDHRGGRDHKPDLVSDPEAAAILERISTYDRIRTAIIGGFNQAAKRFQNAFGQTTRADRSDQRRFERVWRRQAKRHALADRQRDYGAAAARRSADQPVSELPTRGISP